MAHPTAPPAAPRRPHTWDRPTGPADDHYAWLADRDDPETTSYLEAENAWADAWFAGHEALVDELDAEIRSRIQQTDTSAPVPHAGWWYLRRTEEGLDYPIFCRGETAETAADTVLLDVNAEADGEEFFSLGLFDVAPDHHLIAWSADVTGRERYTLRFRDTRTGRDLDEHLVDTTWAGSAWSADGEHLFYVVQDAAERPYKVMRHRMGTPQAEDVEVWRDDDERFFVGVGDTRSGRWIVLGAGSKLTSEIWVIPADDATAAPTCVRPREEGVEYDVDDWGDVFVISTNLDAEDFRVVTAPHDAPGEWEELVPHEPGSRVVSVQPFADHLAVLRWRDMQRQVEIRFRDGTTRTIDALDGPHDVGIGANRDFETDTLRIGVVAMAVPSTTYDVDVRTGERTLVKTQPTPNVDLDAYVAERRWATAEDGTRVPVDLVHHVDTPLDGTAACLLYGYGSYEISVPTTFSVPRLSLLDRGVVFALAHPRGGGEGGRRWYLDGKLLHKRNTFTDTLAVADHLVDSGVSAADRLAIRGGSAGGLLVGACVTMRPERFAAAVADVPFVDIVTTMSDPSIPLTVTEWEEWGDPRSEPHASYMLSYSPYDNTVPGEYPAIYITAGLNDPRVQYHEPAKWTARLREVATSDRPILLKTEMGAGHQGPSGRYAAWRDEARTLAFLLVTTGA